MKEKWLLIFILCISYNVGKTSEVKIVFTGVQKLREIKYFGSVGDFANLFIPVVLEPNFEFNIPIDNQKTIGISFYVEEFSLDVPLYLEKDESIKIIINSDNMTVEFEGLRGKIHSDFYQKFLSFRSTFKNEGFPCANKFIKTEYKKCIDEYINSQIMELAKDSLCAISTTHFILYFISYAKMDLGFSTSTPDYIKYLLTKYIKDSTDIPQNLNNYTYYSNNYQFGTVTERSFLSIDLHPYNYMLNIEDPEILSFMLQVQFLGMYNMNFPFNNFCETYKEISTYTINHPKFPLFTEINSCFD